MPIEIKELHIKVTVPREEPPAQAEEAMWFPDETAPPCDLPPPSESDMPFTALAVMEGGLDWL